jgi:Yip1 domain
MGSMTKDSIARLQSSFNTTPAGVWVSAVFRPSVVTYERLFRRLYPRRRFALTWILLGALIGGFIVSLEPLLAPFIRPEPFDTGLLLAIPLYALIATLSWAIFIGCMHGVARLLKGVGTYSQTACTCATFSAPLIVVASALVAIPWSGVSWSGVLSLCLYVYWLVLYTIALRAVDQFSRAKALSAVLIAVLLCSGAFLGIILIVT